MFSQIESITYLHHEPISFAGRLTRLLLQITVNKNKIQNVLLNSNYQSKSAEIPKKYVQEFNISKIQIKGRDVFTVAPKNKISDKCILYLHGGAYVYNILKLHWHSIAGMVRKTNATFLVPDYPLAPVHTVKDAIPFIEEVYRHLIHKTTCENIIFMGDSAGGGLALAFAQHLKKNNTAQPSQIILISPWLDISTSNPEMKEIEKKDPTLGIEGLQIAGKSWMGELDIKDYLVSPIYGELDGLAKLSIFIGGQDIFIADTKRIKKMMSQKGIAFNYFEYPEMFHVWIGAPFLKETKFALEQIATLITNE